MLMNFAQLERYSENNRIEAKRATGGFPQSVWETYSAFANTLGGIILLGVEERKDYSLRAVTLPDAEGLAREFWRLVNDKKTVSANILSRGQVCVEEVDGKKIVVITVPRAMRQEKPIYVGSIPFGGSYRRSGEGDYKCSKAEVEEMLLESALQTPDMQTVAGVDLSALCQRSVQAYRKRVEAARPQNAWEEEGEKEFLSRAGVIVKGEDRIWRPTAAGLLLLGKRSALLKVFPEFGLEYWEDGALILTGKNLFTFYFAVQSRLRGYPVQVKKALLEGLANSLMNADYFDGGKIILSKRAEEVIFSNPGGFRIDMERAKKGGVADPRNEGIVKLFHLMGVGTGAGSGIPHIYETWRAQGWASPTFIEGVAPARITLVLPFSQKAWGGKLTDEGLLRELTIGYLTDHATATVEELSALLGDLSVVEQLTVEGIVVERGGRYALKR